MATLDIGGQHVTVDDSFLSLPHEQQQSTVDEIAASLKSKPETGMAEDAAKSVAAGLGSGTIGALGAVGDIRSLASKGVDALGSKLGVDLSPVKKVAGYLNPIVNYAPTSADIRSTVTDPIVSPDYEPQYETGRLLKKSAEYAPGMLLGGPEGTAARFATNVAAPAIGSEVGGAVAGPVGELAGGLMSAGGATKAARAFQEAAAARQAAKAIPTGQDLLNSGSNKFEAVKASDAVLKPSSVEQMAKDIKTEMLNEGKHPTSEGQAGVFAALDRLEAMGQAPGGVTPKDMEVIRKSLVDLKPNRDAGPTARMAADKFMEKYSSLGPNDLLNGQNPFPVLKEAVGDWAAGKRSNAVTGKMDLAKLNADTAGSGANIDNNTRQAIKQLVRPMNNTNVPIAKKLGFNDEEIAAMRRVAAGTPLGNTMRWLGKEAPTGAVSGASSVGLGELAAGPAGAVALPVVGFIAKKIGDLSTQRAVQAVDSLVRSRSPLAAKVAAQLPPQIINQLPSKTTRLLQAMILADPALAKAASPSQSVGQPNTY